MTVDQVRVVICLPNCFSSQLKPNKQVFAIYNQSVYNGYMTTVLNVKIDEKLKKEAQKAAKALGLPISTVVTANLREFVRTRTITISEEGRLKPEVEAELLKTAEAVRNGTADLSPAFTNAQDAIAWLKEEVEKENAQ